MDFSPRMTQQIRKVIYTARRLEDCSLPLITNYPVITDSYKRRLWEKWVTALKNSIQKFLGCINGRI
jgi:hypothetical protein